jgi:GGDEF domain-containing protein
MPEEDARPRRRGALFGVQRAYVDDLEQRLEWSEGARDDARFEISELSGDLKSARLALAETTGWTARLPPALQTLAALAAGHLDWEREQPREQREDAEQRLGTAVLALAGEHLLAQVEVSVGEPAGELERETRVNENGRPVRTVVRLGACAVDCTWQPGVDADLDTTEVIEGMCAAVVCSLAGVAASRAERDEVTQLGDARSLSRHLALRNRLDQPAAILRITVDGRSAIEHQELYGRLALSASLADAAAATDRLARTYGGQAYQTGDLEFRVLVDDADVDAARYAAQERLSDYDGLIFRVDVDRA